MSENKETIEERYEKAQGILDGLYGADNVPSREPEFLEHFIKDLMTEREKLKAELLQNTQQFKLNRQELLDRSIDIVDELECGDASEAMAEELRDTLTMLLGNKNMEE